ncbi:coiled-coil domain-containing protein 138 isoform X2 [Anabas testudineus]|uniref:coiled-coil domain-containing protein 138 isoform X2 n=1 Tax=Anabas testudineus TaxID=64144 RepID=UPI000E457EB0|nr:coiled-coil domain-containing protein 138 isoform X2 [Anabas testudineus]
MNKHFKDAESDAADVVEKLKQKYVERRKQLRPSEDNNSGASDEAVQRQVLARRSNQASKELKCYSKALHELFKAVTNHPDQFGSDHSQHGSNDDLSGESVVVPLQDSQMPFTETDVTLPSCLDGSPGSHETEAERELQQACQLPDSCRSSSLMPLKVYQEMMTIYEQLKAERQSQQQWERQLYEREKRLKQQEEAVGRLAGLEEMLHTRILAVEKKHQQELSELQVLLQERSKENKRLKSSFDTIKELNDNMRKQLSQICEQNKRLESQYKRVQARLENLQRKYDHSTASRGCQKVGVKSPESIKQSKKTAPSGKPSNKGIMSSTTLKLLTLLLDWVLDGQGFLSSARNEVKGAEQRVSPEVGLNERCLKVLPLLADELHHTAWLEPDLLLNVLRLIHSALTHLDNGTQHVALSATLRRIGDEVSKPTAQSADLSKSCSEAAGPLRNWPLYRSPCPHTRILSTLLILRTVFQADVVAQALDSLHTELMSVESRGLFILYGGVRAVLLVLRAGRGGLHKPIDILMQLTEQSRYLNHFLDACSCEEFFRTTSQLLKNSRLELPSLEKLSMLLQKLSSIRKNRRLFELSSLHLQIQELYHRSDLKHTFLCINLRSILHNLR